MPTSAAVTPPPSLTVWFDGPVPVLKLPDRLAFEPMRRWLRSVIPPQLDTIGGRTARLDMGDRDLVLFDVRRLVHGLEEEFGITVTGLYLSHENVVRFAQRELKLKLFFHDDTHVDDSGADTAFDRWASDDEPGLQAVAVEPPDVRERQLGELGPVPIHDPSDGSRPALPVFRTLRSGSQVRFDGHVYVYGDVNPGAQVVATGHVVVLGALKGVAHAGAHGDESAFIVAFSMRPTQLRIGRHLSVEPTPPAGHASPMLATVSDQTIRVRPYEGRIPR
ncbi:MAG: septum site-determining protein MinC [Myxococcota bacterium]